MNAGQYPQLILLLSHGCLETNESKLYGKVIQVIVLYFILLPVSRFVVRDSESRRMDKYKLYVAVRGIGNQTSSPGIHVLQYNRLGFRLVTAM